MKTLLISLMLLTATVEAKDQYRLCIQSQSGAGCSKELFDKKTIFKIRDLFVKAPIPADYAVWVEDAKTKSPVKGPHDPEPQAAPQPPITDGI